MPIDPNAPKEIPREKPVEAPPLPAELPGGGEHSPPTPLPPQEPPPPSEKPTPPLTTN